MAGDALLRLATLEYPPYITLTAQGPQGLAVNIVNTAFARLGQPVHIAFYPISRGQFLLQSGGVDGFFSIKKTQAREREFLFPQEALFRQDYVFFVRRDSPWRFNGSFDALADARIGVVGRTSYGERFDRAAQAGRFHRLDVAASHDMNFRKLLAGRVDAVICSRLVGVYYLKSLNGLELAGVSGPPVETTSSYLVFGRQKDFAPLARRLDRVLRGMAQDGTLARLAASDPLLQGQTAHKRRP